MLLGKQESEEERILCSKSLWFYFVNHLSALNLGSTAQKGKSEIAFM